MAIKCLKFTDSLSLQKITRNVTRTDKRLKEHTQKNSGTPILSGHPWDQILWQLKNLIVCMGKFGQMFVAT